MLPTTLIELACTTPAPNRSTHAVVHAIARAISPAPRTNFARIPAEAIALFIPRSPLSNPFSVSYFPPLPSDWPASRQRWQRHAFRGPETLRSYWLLRRAAQYR